jgi:hypothetical protein
MDQGNSQAPSPVYKSIEELSKDNFVTLRQLKRRVNSKTMGILFSKRKIM